MAGNAVIGALRVVLGADTAAFDKGLKEAQGRLAVFKTRIGSASRELINLRSAMVVVGAAAGVAFVRRMAAAGDEIVETAEKISISTDALQELRYAAGLAGVKSETLDASLLELNKRLGDIRGGITGAAMALGRLGLSIEDVKGKDAAEVFKEIGERLRGVADPMQRASIVAGIFGQKAGKELLPVLLAGRAGLAALAAEAHRLGLVLGTDTLAKAGKVSDEFDRMAAALKVAGVNIAVGALPALRDLREVVTSQEFQVGIRNIGTGLADAVKWMVDHKETILTVTAALAGMKIGASVGRAFGGQGALIGGALGGLAGMVARAELARDKIKELERELEILEDQRRHAAGRLIGEEDPSRIMAIAGQIDALKNRIAEVRTNLEALKKAAAGASEITKITVPGKPLEHFPQVTEAIEQLAFKTRILRGDFDALAPGFAEMARGLKVFGTDGRAAVTTVSELHPQLRQLNDVMLKHAAAKLIEDTRTAQEKLNAELARLQMLQPHVPVENFARALQKVQFPSLSKSIEEFTDIARQMDSFLNNTLDRTADALTDVIMGTKSAAEAFEELGRSVVRDLTKMIVKALLWKAVSSVLGFAGGGAPPGGGFGGFAGFMAKGGFVPPGQWAIAGESGMEAVFGGRLGATVVPQSEIAPAQGGVQVVNHNVYHFQPGMSGTDMAAIKSYVDMATRQSSDLTVERIAVGMRDTSDFFAR